MPSLVESSSVYHTLFRLLIGKIIILLNLSSFFSGGGGWAHFFGRSLLMDFYDSLRVQAIGQAIGEAIGSRAWSPKALTIYLSSMY